MLALPDNHFGDTPLHRAALAAEREELMEPLIQGGADINARNQLGQTPLHDAVSFIVAMRIQAPYKTKPEKKRFWFAIAPTVASVGVLLRHGADVSVQDDEGLTPLDIYEGIGGDGIILDWLHHAATSGRADDEIRCGKNMR